MKGKGLAVAVGLLAAVAVVAGGGGSAAGEPKGPGPDEGDGDELAPAAVMKRVAAALATKDPAKMRAEAKRLAREGWNELANELEAKATERAAEIELEKRNNTGQPKPGKPATVPVIPISTAPRVLTEGMKGADVTTWQKQLIKDGYAVVKADGIFGPVTKSSTQIWQAERGLKPDGIVGPATRGAIGMAPIASVPGAPSSQPTAAATPAAPKPSPAAPKPSAPAAPKPAPAPAMVSTAPRLLKVGVQGDDVRAWQLQLINDGASTLKADGVFGQKTKEATAAWQLARGLSADGIVGPDTRSKVGKPVQRKPEAPTTLPPLTVNPSTWRTLKEGMTGPDVKEWQIVLQRDGFAINPDGVFGAKTKAATIGWQTTHGLAPDGVVGKGTRTALGPDFQVVAGEAAEVLEALVQGPPALRLVHSVAVPAEASPAQLGEAVAEHVRGAADGHEDRELIERFQRAVGLNATGAYGPATARAIAAFGIVPPKPRVWPAKKLMRAKTQYRFAMLERSRKDPPRAAEWVSASQV